MSLIIDPLDFWYPQQVGECWVCGVVSDTAYLDLGYQHMGCDMFPTEDGDEVWINHKQVTVEERNARFTLETE